MDEIVRAVEGSAPAARVVTEFLAAMEARDLDRAGRMLAPGAEMVFPGEAAFGDLPALVDWARPRYRRVGKRFDRSDAAPTEDGDVVVVQGVLHGEWPDEEPFDGIRFVDWFLVRGGLIVAQRVWNDLAEAARA